MQQKIKAFLEKEGIEKLAERLQTTVHTLQVIIDGLSQPESFDFRTGKQLNLNNCTFHLHSSHCLLWPSQQSYAIGKTALLPFYTGENSSMVTFLQSISVRYYPEPRLEARSPDSSPHLLSTCIIHVLLCAWRPAYFIILL